MWPLFVSSCNVLFFDHLDGDLKNQGLLVKCKYLAEDFINFYRESQVVKTTGNGQLFYKHLFG